MRLTSLAASLLTATAVLGGSAASAAAEAGHDAPVPILSTSFAKSRVDVLAGDTVSWRNSSVRQHTVSATAGDWSSPRLSGGATFSHRFDTPGDQAYYCQLHPFMRGVVNVHPLLLTPPSGGAVPGRPFVLKGRAALPAGTTVSIETADGDRRLQAVTTATVDAAGAFEAKVSAQSTTSFRAVAGTAASPSVQVLVVDHGVQAAAHRRGRRVVVSARVQPSAPGATVVLQLRLRERFGWWTVRRADVDRHSRAVFSLAPRHAVRARVVLMASDGETPLARSAPLVVRPRG